MEKIWTFLSAKWERFGCTVGKIASRRMHLPRYNSAGDLPYANGVARYFCMNVELYFILVGSLVSWRLVSTGPCDQTPSPIGILGWNVCTGLFDVCTGLFRIFFRLYHPLSTQNIGEGELATCEPSSQWNFGLKRLYWAFRCWYRFVCTISFQPQTLRGRGVGNMWARSRKNLGLKHLYKHTWSWKIPKNQGLVL